MFRMLLVLGILCSSTLMTHADDWPMWRYDAHRGNSTPSSLPKNLVPQWTRQLPTPRPAWPKTQPRLQFDEAPQPVVSGQHIFVPSTATDSVTAYDTRNGEEVWRFYADGPVRFAPVVAKGRVHFVSDDGYLYTVDAKSGKLLWKFNGGPQERWLIGNKRLISSWPARGGPVLHEGKLFFTASIWPFMGLFVHALNPETGEVIWTNSGDGSNWTDHPHGGAIAFGTIAPQGHLAASQNHLVVPGGRSTPAVFDTKTGKLLHFRFDGRNGDHKVAIGHDVYYVGHFAYHAPTSQGLGLQRMLTIDNQVTLLRGGTDIVEVRKGGSEVKEVVTRDRRGNKTKTAKYQSQILSTVTLKENAGEKYLKAGTQLFSFGGETITAYELDPMLKTSEQLRPFWTQKVQGEIHHLLVADDRLFVVTRDAKLYCFGPRITKTTHHTLVKNPLPKRKDVWTQRVTRFATQEGYCIVLGIGSGRLVTELLQRTRMSLIVLDNDSEKVNAFRRMMDDAGVYGSRVSAKVGNASTFPFPNYMAKVVVTEDSNVFLNKATLENVYRAVRPYGGTIKLFDVSEKNRMYLAKMTKAWPKCTVRSERDTLFITREGALPNTDDWTHQYGDAGQTGVSRDKLVKAPLGLLWFGGPSHEGILPRHGHGPSPQVAGGRLFIEGPDMLRAVDVYTGEVLWEKKLKDFGKYYNTTRHFAGAGEIGSNYVSMSDHVYAVYGNVILELDAATGKLTREFKLNQEEGEDTPYWGHISVWNDLLITTSSPVAVGKISSGRSAKATIPSGASVLIKPGAKWQYLANGTDPQDLKWTRPGFEAKGWKVGQAGFGYGDGDDKTVLNMRGKFTRIYVRHEFDSQLLDEDAVAELLVNYDDAFIAYLNGKEIVRAGVGQGRGKLARNIQGHEAGRFEVFRITDWKKLVRPGKNVLAFEGHNTSLRSSDLTLAPILITRNPNKKVAKIPHKANGDKGQRPNLPTTKYSAGSRKLLVFDRQTGKLLWSRDAEFNFRHNTIAVGGGKVFCIDNLTASRRRTLERRGVKFNGTPTLYAFDAQTGKVVWKTTSGVFGTFLNYSEEQDFLLQGGSSYRDRAQDEVNRGLVAYRGRDGKVLWKNPTITYSGPCLLMQDKIITNGAGGFAINSKTGQPTGWKYARKYGCNTALASDYLLTFRSGAAGFCDLANDSGTGNLGGFRSSCTNNLIVANGVLNAPDYTRTCSCAYQNQTSLALIHMPEAEFWTFGGKTKSLHAGINFAAPGDRRAPNGTLWKKDGAEFEPENTDNFRMHSLMVKGDELNWVAASGLRGVTKVRVPVERPGQYRVKLVFLEPENVAEGDRVFDVVIDGKTVLKGFDVLATAGSARRSALREFVTSVSGESVEIQLRPRTKRPAVLSGVEVIGTRVE
ncbi:MAG: PQQ-binding-like beta-propeller repeat protein [Gemmataceae bacterium]